MATSTDNRISVVVPFFGGEEFVEPCLESILSQTHRNLELILVNDGSPDRTGEICDCYAAVDRRIRVIHQVNAGLVRARKIGVASATGPFLSFVDGDDWIGPDYLAQMYDLMASSQVDLVISGHTREFMGRYESIPPTLRPGVYSRSEIEHLVLPQAIFNGVFFHHGVSTYVWNKMFRLKEAEPLVQRIPDTIVMGEDAALTYPYLTQCQSLGILSESSYYYRQRPHSILKSIPSAEVEYARLGALAHYLRQAFEGSPARETLIKQLKVYLYALVLTRSGGILRSSATQTWSSPYRGLADHERIVVCSSGSFGHHVVNSLTQLETFEMVGWIDEDASESQLLGLPVTPFEAVLELDFDLLLIASVDTEYCNRVAQRLTELGVLPEKISQIQPDLSSLDEALTQIGFDTSSYAYTLEM